MAMQARPADPARDRFINSSSREPATSFVCAACAPTAPTGSPVIVDDGFNRWQRCSGCGELIFTTQPVDA